jgi:hypothetical protein
MKHIALFLILTPLLFQQKCDLRSMTSPEGVQSKVEESIHLYFPNAKAEVLPKQRAILVLSCVQGVSPQFVEKIMNSMAQDPSMTSDLDRLKLLPYLGGVSYKYFVLSFDGGWIWYDMETRQLDIREMPEQAQAGYQQTCFPEPSED